MIISTQGWYALIDAGTVLDSLNVANNTLPISVSGTYLKSTYSDFLHSDYTFQGDLFPNQITVNGQMYVVTHTAIIVNYSNENTVTSTQIYGIPTQSGYLPITVSGTLAWSTPSCVSPLAAQQASIPFNALPIVIVLAIGVLILAAAVVLAYPPIAKKERK